MKKQETSLIKISGVAALLHLAAFVWAIVGSGKWHVQTKNTFNNWKKNDPDDEEETPFIVPTVRDFGFTVSLEVIVYVFHAVSLIFQLAAAAALSSSTLNYYKIEISNKRNIFRWIEYAITAPIMAVAIAVLEGQSDFFVLWFVYWCSLMLMYFGYLTECHRNDMKKMLFNHFLGWALFIATWFPIAHSFDTSINGSKVRPPNSVKPLIITVFWTMVTFYASFGILQTVDVVFKVSYVTIEKCYIVLSLLSKTCLGLLVMFITRAFDEMDVAVVNEHKA